MIRRVSQSKLNVTNTNVNIGTKITRFYCFFLFPFMCVSIRTHRSSARSRNSPFQRSKKNPEEKKIKHAQDDASNFGLVKGLTSFHAY